MKILFYDKRSSATNMLKTAPRKIHTLVAIILIAGASPSRADLVPPLAGASGRMPPIGEITRDAAPVKERHEVFSPLVTAALAASPNAQIAEGLSVGYAYQDFGSIAYSSALNYGVDAESSGAYASFGFGQAQISRAWQDYKVKITSPSVNSSTKRRGEIINFKVASGKIKLPMGVRAAIGASRYSESGYSFSQPFIAASIIRGKAQASAGINWTTGDAPRYSAAPFGSAQAEVFRSAVAFVDYSARDFNKVIVNNYLLPATGIDCSGCSRDALNFGLAVRSGIISAAAGVYDASDLATPFGNLSLNLSF